MSNNVFDIKSEVQADIVKSLMHAVKIIFGGEITSKGTIERREKNWNEKQELSPGNKSIHLNSSMCINEHL